MCKNCVQNCSFTWGFSLGGGLVKTPFLDQFARIAFKTDVISVLVGLSNVVPYKQGAPCTIPHNARTIPHNARTIPHKGAGGPPYKLVCALERHQCH